MVYDGMWHFDVPKCRDVDGGKVEVIARNQCGEAYASTTLTVAPRKDDYRSVLKHNVKRKFITTERMIQYLDCYQGLMRIFALILLRSYLATHTHTI